MSSKQFPTRQRVILTNARVPSPNQRATPGQKEQHEKRNGKYLLLSLLVLLLMCTLCLWAYYLTTRKPLPEILPPARVVAQAIKPHYLFSIYGMQEPVGVAVTPEGDGIYVAESGGERLIRVFDRDGRPLAAFAPPQSQPPSRAPVFIALDNAGLVYVSDRLRHSVDIYDAGGNYRSSLKPLTSDGWSPVGLRFVGGDLYLTELTEKKHRVLVMDNSAKLTLQFGREGQGVDELWFPNSAIEDARGRIYVSDSNNGRVQVYDQGGKLLYTIPGFSLPRGLAIDADQRLYVVDAVGHIVKVYDATREKAEPLFDFGDLGMGNAQFNYPNDIAIDSTGRLYIADRANNRVQVWLY